jgi:PTS system cellobiose-specific IIB component
MTTILIVCGAGASSTFLASAMRSLAASRGIPVTIQAASDDDIESRLPFSDIVLVGAHLASSFDVLRARAAEHDVAAALLPADVFGLAGAETALELASGIAPAGRLALHHQPKETPHG